MKSALCLILGFMLLLPPGACADEVAGHEFLVLMSFGGTQSGGDEAAFIDERGGLYYIDMEAEGLYWSGEETLAMLRALPDAYRIGALAEAELAEVRRLIDAIEITAPTRYGMAACDAGVFEQTAYRTLESGERQALVLLTAGDEISENTDRSAVILSSWLLDVMRFSHNMGRRAYLFPYSDSVPLYLSFEHGSFFGGSRTYTLRREGDRVRFSILGANGDETDISAEIDDSHGFFARSGVFSELQQLIDGAGIAAWDGFDERDEQVLDGDGFALFIDYGTSTIQASGYERYPEGYSQALSALTAFFEALALRAEAAE